MKKYFCRNISEIFHSRALNLYGVLLALSHVLSAYFWMENSLRLVSAALPLCWPMMPFCESFRFSDGNNAALFLYFYAALGLITAVAFYLQKRVAYFLLAGLLVLKVYFLSLSYGLMGNYHYMGFIVHLAFLFVPHKKQLIPFIIGIFYWGAGLLKFNPEWLSGVALVRPSFLSPLLQHLSLIYVVILETILVFGLFSKKPLHRYLILGQFFLFHLFSWHIVGYFYPLTMFLLLGLFILIPLGKEPWESYLDQNLIKNKSSLGLLLLLASLQFIPYMFSKDPATSGAPRLVSLNMLDANVHCETVLIRNLKNAGEIYDPFIRPPSTRTQCDPIVYLNQIHRICQNDDGNFDFWLQSRRSTESQLQTRLHIKDVCKKSFMALFWAEIL
ncbi:HTTM domain-containing protein [Bdellovibrio reynosensis]|uniref:HTTM domain-containing protein n=1 Tax=Bdellovibrio reynosensis TaxID=2835041 RepID=A0ABY4CDE3_9BACT|nr:HTTM domain-containing protein [Bdellovibrio reynosensis]UOF02474.1 HTTM domain-containing protein [Bdellovibrio reynosensis]